MLQDSFRKHTRWWLLVVLIFMVPPFVFFNYQPSSGGGARQDGSDVIGNVGDVDITVADVVRYAQRELNQLRQQGQEDATMKDLQTSGALQEITKQIVQEKLVELEINRLAYNFDNEFLAEQLKEAPQFQNEDGTFNADAWNSFVNERGIDWNAEYERLNDAWRRQIFYQRVTGPARVIERDLREDFADRNSTVEVKYLLVELPVEPTEEEIQANYDEFPDRYRDPDERVVDFVSFNAMPPVPEIADEIVDRARAGEDFAELAKEYSEGPLADSGGDLDWVKIDDNLARSRSVLKELSPGQVSDVVQFGRGYYIFKVEEERTGEDGETREVKARQIQFAPEMSDDERAAVRARAEEFAAEARLAEDFAAAAEEAGLEVKRTSAFSVDSEEIDNVPLSDMFSFRNGFRAVEKDGVSEVVEGTQAFYVGAVADLIVPELKPLEEVREDVINNVIAQRKNTDAYKNEVREFAERIAEADVALDEIPEKFPELANPEVKTTAPFTAATFQFPDGLFWNVGKVIELAKSSDPGDLMGPMDDLIGKTYFLELVNFEPPSQEVWDAKWETEREQMRQRALQVAQSQIQADYITYLEERAYETALETTPLRDSVVLEVLGITDEPEGETPASGEPSGFSIPEPEPADDAAAAEPPAEEPAETPEGE